MLNFEKCCEEISAKKSRAEKLAILESYKRDKEVMDLFILGFSAPVNFNVILPETEKQYTDLDYEKVVHGLKGLISKTCLDGIGFWDFYIPKLGKWLIKLINRNLKLGVAEAAIEKVWPGMLGYTKMMEPDEIKFGAGEDFHQLMFHLEDSKNWSIYGASPGIAVLVAIEKGKVFFSTTQPVNIINTELIEKELLKAFEFDVILQGKLLLNKSRTTLLGGEKVNSSSLNDTYKAYTEDGISPEELQLTFFQIQDAPPGPTQISLDFDHRQKWISLIKLVEDGLPKTIGLTYDHIGLVKRQPIDYSSDHQLKELREAGFSKAYLCYDKGEYKLGKSRDFLTLRL
jgi:hypothetical protein